MGSLFRVSSERLEKPEIEPRPLVSGLEGMEKAALWVSMGLKIMAWRDPKAWSLS